MNGRVVDRMTLWMYQLRDEFDHLERRVVLDPPVVVRYASLRQTNNSSTNPAPHNEIYDIQSSIQNAD